MLYFILFVLLAIIGIGGFLWLQHQSGSPTGTALFGTSPNRRLEVVEVTPIRGGRKLMLIKRDDVEHLVMTGGPVDVVVETGIITHSRSERPAEPGRHSEPLFAPPEDTRHKPPAPPPLRS